MNNKLKVGFGLVLSLVSVTAPAFAGTAATPAANKQEKYENLELFQKVLHFVETNYVDEVKNKELIHGAIKGMLETLDPHSNFLPPDLFRDMKIDTAGTFGGVGIEIGMKDNVLTVIAPIEDTPAWKAGVKPGDRVLKINGETTKGLSLTESVAKMRGKRGSDVKLFLYRDGFKAPKEVVLKRDTIKIQSVKSDLLEPGYGYVRLSNFNENAAKDLKKAMNALEKKAKFKGVILDLRTNPGGLLDQAVDVSSLFIDDGVIVSTIGRNRDQKEIKYARRNMARKDFPVAVLVNSSTASAAEIVAGALQDHHRAIIMGQPTFGKGSVQTVIDLGQDMGLKLTIARYYTASGRSIQEKGVYPDVLLEEYDPKLLAEARRTKTTSTREKDLKGHIVGIGGEKSSSSPDDEGGIEGDTGEFNMEELKNLSQASKKGEDGDEDMTPAKFAPKEDFQVQAALSQLKSYAVFKKIAKTEEEVSGTKTAKSSITE